MGDVVTLTKHGSVGCLTLDNPPVNGLGAKVRSALDTALKAAIGDPEIEVLVLHGANGLFSGGADIREFGKPPDPSAPHLPDLILTVEDSAKPVIAAIDGVCAGGALELALGCHYRVASVGWRIGLPEVTLGIVPGAGGTQRLPRLIGAGPALEVITGGKLLPAQKVFDHGILDELVEGDLIEATIAFANSVTGRPWRKVREIDDKTQAAGSDPELFTKFRKNLGRRARGAKAPFACVDCIEVAVSKPFAEGAAFERETFLKCVASEQSAALRHAFFAEREAAKIPDVPKDTQTVPVESAAVIGCGTMGGGIAMNFANAGIPVKILDTSRESLDRGMATIQKNYAASAAKGRMSEDDVHRRLGLITGTLKFADLAEVDLVIEAVFEEMSLKQEVFGKLDAVCKAGAVLATNTSTLDVDKIAESTARPEQVIGTHFFSPANVMRLMENVRGAKTSKEVIATVMRLSKRLGKIGVLVGVADGFVGNRMLYAYSRQANFLLEEGALPQQVDKVITDFGFPMGPFAMGDLAGLDVGWRIRQSRAATRPTHLRYSTIADRICEQGRFGQKTGSGWYRYEQGSRTPVPDPEIEALITSVSTEIGIERREITDEEILQRCMFPLINEGAKILDEKLALRASDIDVVWMYGYAFPRHRGGPMYYADQIGPQAVYEKMCQFHEVHGEWLEPAPLLARLAEEGKSFAEHA